MEWYWWVLIFVGVVAIGYLKIKVFNKMKENSARKKEKEEEQED
ncbi:MAG: hypothetical protein R6W96_04130 [Clostridia bacterium]